MKANGDILIAAPAVDVGFEDVYSLQAFFFKGKQWPQDPKWSFLRDDVIKGNSWLVLGRSFEPQPKTLNFTEVCYAVTMYRGVRGKNKLPDLNVRTSSFKTVGCTVCDVCVSGNGGNGLNMYFHFGR